MNDKILTEKLSFPPYFSKEAKSLLSQVSFNLSFSSKLLERNPRKRLGNAEDIKKHPFFREIEWSKMDGKQIQPAFRPPLVFLRLFLIHSQLGELDTRFFDPESTRMAARHSVCECHLTSTEQEAFRGFSYV